MAKFSLEPKTIITFLLDRTGSMQSVKPQTIQSFNTYLDTLKRGDADIDFTFVQFDSMSLDKICVRSAVKDVQPLTDSTYQPRAWTPLIDAAYKTIKAVEASLKDEKVKVIICIQTDGNENSSTEYSWKQLNDLIKEKMDQGWQFNFMGAGIDAYTQGNKMGIPVDNTVAYSTDLRSTQASFGATASNAINFARGLSGSTSYSLGQKAASGDKFIPPQTQAPVPPPVTPVPPSAPAKAVQDFSL